MQLHQEGAVSLSSALAGNTLGDYHRLGQGAEGRPMYEAAPRTGRSVEALQPSARRGKLPGHGLSISPRSRAPPGQETERTSSPGIFDSCEIRIPPKPDRSSRGWHHQPRDRGTPHFPQSSPARIGLPADSITWRRATPTPRPNGLAPTGRAPPPLRALPPPWRAARSAPRAQDDRRLPPGSARTKRCWNGMSPVRVKGAPRTLQTMKEIALPATTRRIPGSRGSRR